MGGDFFGCFLLAALAHGPQYKHLRIVAMLEQQRAHARLPAFAEFGGLGRCGAAVEEDLDAG